MARCLVSGEWKAATVLAGSIVEALLLDSLHQREASDSSALHSSISSLRSKNVLNKAPPSNLDDWNLHQMTEVAASLDIIHAVTAGSVGLRRASVT